ncbi:hypothetical protein [Shimia ponticola]|uniref:hypothetical protein n=1 Tax=Shimia ponticola TaxID=2582893 RepID=UPI0011BE90B5|nr:hypothetical protein [Shimia ponticola]
MTHVDHADSIVIAIISTTYLVFAIQVRLQTTAHGRRTKAGRALNQLVNVFVLCMVSGYVSDLLPPSWWIIREVFHWALAAAALRLVLSNQAGAVSAALDNGPHN